MVDSALDRVTTERLICERIHVGHRQELAQIMFDPKVLEWLWDPFEEESPTEDDLSGMLRSLVDHWQRHGFGYWLVRDRATGEAVGRGGVRWTDATGEPQVEAGWVIVSSRWGQGLATELARAAVAAAFGPLELPEVIAYTLPGNIASRRVMEKASFAYEREFDSEGLPHVLYRRLAAAGDQAPRGGCSAEGGSDSATG
jgi:RimJ/RimL family protein N-acetyltransferase